MKTCYNCRYCRQVKVETDNGKILSKWYRCDDTYQFMPENVAKGTGCDTFQPRPKK